MTDVATRDCSRQHHLVFLVLAFNLSPISIKDRTTTVTNEEGTTIMSINVRSATASSPFTEPFELRGTVLVGVGMCSE